MIYERDVEVKMSMAINGKMRSTGQVGQGKPQGHRQGYYRMCP